MPSSPQQRRRRIRRTVGAASLATFAIAWGTIAGTGAMGHSRSTAAGGATQQVQRVQSGDDDRDVEQQRLPQMTTRQS